jgi:hypothetical protein
MVSVPARFGDAGSAGIHAVGVSGQQCPHSGLPRSMVKYQDFRYVIPFIDSVSLLLPRYYCP